MIEDQLQLTAVAAVFQYGKSCLPRNRFSLLLS